MNDKPRLWAVIGATGTGKTALSLDLAEALGRSGHVAEIVNADAMQLYRGMDIGTAKIPPAERRGIPHHLFDVLDVTEDAAVARYQRQAKQAVRGILDAGRDAILVGGSGLYVSAVLFDFAFPPRDERVRERLEAELAEAGAGPLYQRLRTIDPATAARIDPRNARRVVRALEIIEQGDAGHGAALPEEPRLWHPATTILGTATERDRLVARLDARVEQMWRDGIVEEAAALRGQGLREDSTAGRAIGYAQALAQLDGRLDAPAAIASAQALTRKYARRQVSWFRRYRDVVWLDVSDPVDRAARLSRILGG